MRSRANLTRFMVIFGGVVICITHQKAPGVCTLRTFFLGETFTPSTGHHRLKDGRSKGQPLRLSANFGHEDALHSDAHETYTGGGPTGEVEILGEFLGEKFRSNQNTHLFRDISLYCMVGK